MRRYWRLVVLLLMSFSGQAFCTEIYPIYKSSRQSFGVAIVGVRADETYLYLRTDSLDLIAFNKAELLAGTASAVYLKPSKWSAEIEQRRTSAIDAVQAPPNEGSSANAAHWRAGLSHVQIRQGYCDEGVDERHELRIDGLMVETGMDSCLRSTDPVVFDGKLWFGTFRQGEYYDGPGIGVLVFDLKRKKRVFQILRTLAPGETCVLLADESLGGVWIVNRSAIHFYNREFQLMAKWYYSEQMDTTARNWSVLELTKRPKPHDAFAVLGRIINTPPDRESGDAEKLQQSLSGERWVSSKGIAAYQRYVEHLPQKVRNGFWLHYDDFDRRIFPMWGKDYMAYANGGKGFLSAGELVVCLHVHGEGGRSWVAEDVVQRIVAATQPDAQAYYVDPPQPLAASKSCPSFR